MTFSVRLIALIWLTVALVSVARPQQVTLDQTNVELGTVRQGQRVEHSFHIGNTGTRPLVVELTGISHPGVNVAFSPEVPPGGEATVRIEWDTTLIQGPNTLELDVAFNDRNHTTAVFRVTANVIPDIQILPLPAVYISTFRDEPGLRTIEVRNNTERFRGIERLLAPEWADVRLRSRKPGFLWDVDVELRTDRMDSGFVDGWLEIVWDDERPPRRLPIHAFVKNDVYVNPEEAAFGPVDVKEIRNLPGLRALTTQTFLLTKRNGLLSLLSASSDLPFIQVAFSPPQGARIYQFSVDIDPDKAVPGPFSGTITIRTDDTDFPELVVPVSGELR